MMVRGCEGNRHNNDNNEGISMKTKLFMGSVLAALISTSALAETMTYNATVGAASSCTISNIQNGTLASSSPAMIGTTATGGSAGYFSAQAEGTGWKVAALGDVVAAGLYAPWNGDANVMTIKNSPDDGTAQSTGTINGESAVYLAHGADANNGALTSGNYTVDLTLMLSSAPADGTYTVTHSIVCVQQ